MNAADLAAYIGAAAWIPQITGWIYGRFAKPVLMLVPDRYAEVGYTSYGPIFNLRIAISVDRKPAIIDGIELTLRHEDGEVRNLRWTGLNETFSEIRDDSGNRSVISRDQTPIAVKIGTDGLVEKFVRFQEPRYHETFRPALNELIAHFNYLKQSGDASYVEKLLASKEVFALNEARKKLFWWKPGLYTVTVVVSSPNDVKLERAIWSFRLTAIDVDQLRQNLVTLETELRNIIKSDLPDFQAQPVNWNWANVDVIRGVSDTVSVRPVREELMKRT